MSEAPDAPARTVSAEFLLKDYELKIRFFTDHLSRMWTRFNFFVAIESALVGSKLVFTSDPAPDWGAPLVGSVVSLIWYAMGAQDRYLVALYRGQVASAARLLPGPYRWDESVLGPYVHVGQVNHVPSPPEQGLAQWRSEGISTTKLASLIPLLLSASWFAFLIVTVVMQSSAC